jgi:hypothetical protein
VDAAGSQLSLRRPLIVTGYVLQRAHGNLSSKLLQFSGVRYVYSVETDWTADTVPCGGGLEYFHRSSASRKRRQKRNPVPRGIFNWVILFLRDINTGTWISKLGESQMRQQSMIVSSAGFRYKSDCSVKAQKQLYK